MNVNIFLLGLSLCFNFRDGTQYKRPGLTLMDLTKFAVLFAISLAAWTKCFFATGLFVFADAALHTLQRFEVCFATAVADCNI